LNKTSLALTVGSTEQLNAIVSPSNATDQSVTWSSSNSSVATVSPTGLVTGISNGSATITVTTSDGNKQARCSVSVTIPSVSVIGVSLNKTSLSLGIGATEQLTATVSPSNAADKNVRWDCSNPNVASVSSNGLVTGKAEGLATIVVATQDGNNTATCTVTVTDEKGGTTGTLTWKLSGGTLTISGTGAMPHYGSNYAPWNNYRQSITNIIIENGVTNIGNYAFGDSSYYYTNLKFVTIANTVTKIGNYAFYYSSLEAVTIPNSVTGIGDYAFYGCKLSTLVIPENVTTIGSYAFSGATMHTLTIGASVSSIGSYAFSGATMHTLTIGASVSSIGDYAFRNCYSLTNVSIKNPTPPILYYYSYGGGYYYYDVFSGVPVDVATLTVPGGSKAAYQAAYGWHSFGTIVEVP
jgi:hypothetical protein